MWQTKDNIWLYMILHYYNYYLNYYQTTPTLNSHAAFIMATVVLELVLPSLHSKWSVIYLNAYNTFSLINEININFHLFRVRWLWNVHFRLCSCCAFLKFSSLLINCFLDCPLVVFSIMYQYHYAWIVKLNTNLCQTLHWAVSSKLMLLQLLSLVSMSLIVTAVPFLTSPPYSFAL